MLFLKRGRSRQEGLSPKPPLAGPLQGPQERLLGYTSPLPPSLKAFWELQESRLRPPGPDEGPRLLREEGCVFPDAPLLPESGRDAEVSLCRRPSDFGPQGVF